MKMAAKRLPRLRASISAILLAVVGVLLAWACIKVAIVRVMPATAPGLTAIVSHDPGVTLERASLALVTQRGILTPATIAEVQRSAQAAPLDARAYLILGHQQLLDGQPARALRTLEAGQRFDPRNPLIHLLLLDRYLRTGHFADAAQQFAVSSRLVGPAQGAIAKAMAQMSLAPETREGARRTLAADPELENSVLVTLAKSDTAPSTIFALASPGARRDAGNAESWGPAIVARLIERQRYADARRVWQEVYRLTLAQATPPVFDAGFRELPGSPPFNWTLTASGVGAADITKGKLSVNYYGRDDGVLAGQLLVLGPGAYRFAITVEGTKMGVGPSLFWSLRCATGGKSEVMALPVIATGTPHRAAIAFTIPGGCPAQQLSLMGNPGEFPAPVTLTLRDLYLRRTGGPRR